jgi:Ca2+-binding RTX toxin-like protein
MNRNTPQFLRPLSGLVAAGTVAAVGLFAATPANATFSDPVVANNVLTINGDNGGDAISLRLKAGDPNTLVVDPGDDNAGTNPEFARADFTSIVVNGGGGKDEIRIDDANGVFTDTEATTLNGDSGQDLLLGGGGAETLNGGADSDGISGRGGNDTMNGDAGDDRLRGGPGNDPQQGGQGADEFLWVPGDGDDTNIDGGTEADSLDFDGSNGNENMTIEPDAANPVPGSIHFFRDAGNIDQNTVAVERVRVQALGGNDNVTGAANLDPSIGLELNGGDGTDTLTGGPGNDLIVGARDADTQRGGAGDDTIVWNPGDASDVVDGQAGNDVHDFNGAAGLDQIDVHPDAAQAGHVELLRVQATIDQDIVDTEKIDVDSLGSNDELSAKDGLGNLTQVDFDAGDGNDKVQTGDDADLIAGGEGDDELRAGAGDDTVDGQGGNDSLFGEAGLDRLTGGSGNDTFDCGAPGDVVVDAGPGDTLAGNCAPPPPVNQPAQPGQPVQPTLPGLPAGFRGFARPGISAGGVNTLSVRLRNTHTATIELRLQVTENGVRYRTVTKRIAAGKSKTVKLRVSKQLRDKLARALKRRGKITRRPTIVVTNVETGGKTTVKPKLAVRLPRR